MSSKRAECIVVQGGTTAACLIGKTCGSHQLNLKVQGQRRKRGQRFVLGLCFRSSRGSQAVGVGIQEPAFCFQSGKLFLTLPMIPWDRVSQSDLVKDVHVVDRYAYVICCSGVMPVTCRHASL
jgi:hypothetical protein